MLSKSRREYTLVLWFNGVFPFLIMYDTDDERKKMFMPVILETRPGCKLCFMRNFIFLHFFLSDINMMTNFFCMIKLRREARCLSS